MQVKINKRIKLGLIIITTIFIILSIFLLNKTVKHPGVKEEKVSLYTYNQTANVNYKVFLKPNPLYSEETLDERKIYITKFVNYIDTSLKYQFSGDRKVDVKGDYNITATVEGYVGEGETYKIIWKKEYLLLPKKEYSFNDKKASINENIKLNIDEYNNFVKKIIEETGININVKLVVAMNVNQKVNTDKGLIEETISPVVEIPLNKDYFEIAGNLSQEKPGTIEETKQVQLPVDENKVIMYKIILGILFILLIFMIFFTKAKPMLNPHEKMIKRIFKKHGDRLVALNNVIENTHEKHSEVKSIDDLVRIADEIEKPIMYKHSLDYKEISKFYVYDDKQIYIFDLAKIIIDKNLDNSKKDKSKNNGNKLNKSISEIRASKPKKKESEPETTESKS